MQTDDIIILANKRFSAREKENWNKQNIPLNQKKN
jgi:hypothetical protein